MKYLNKTYLLTAIVIALMLSIFGVLIDFSAHATSPMFYIRFAFDASIIALPVLLVPIRAKKPIAIIISIALAIFLVVNHSYIFYFNQFMPLECYTFFNNVTGIVLACFFETFKKGCLILLPLLLLFFLKKNDIGKIRFVLAGIVLLANALFCYTEYRFTSKILDKCSMNTYNRFSKRHLADVDYMMANGFVPFVCCNLIGDNENHNKNNLFDYKSIDTSPLKVYTSNEYAYSKGKNLIIIFVESLNKFVINYKIDNKEVCPNLNSLYNDSTSISAHFKQQVGLGRSADGHFMVNTGLLPLHDLFTAYIIDTVPALGHSVKWNDSFVVTIDSKNVWNQYLSSVYYGYRENYHSDLIVKDSGCKRVLDKEMFEYAIPKIRTAKQPFIAQLVTISMHDPFGLITDPNEWIDEVDSIDTYTKKYLKCVNYFDNCLGSFLTSLKRTDIYDNTVIAIMGDHCASKQFMNCDNDLSALVIVNSGCPKDSIPHPKNMQQIDIYPTLLDLIGGNEYGWKGVGHSIFRSDEPNDEEALYDLSQKLILSEYFQKTKF